MTQPSENKLSEPQMPVCTRVLSDRPMPTGDPSVDQSPLTWQLAAAHPLMADVQIVRLVVHLGESFEVYGVRTDDPNVCSRHTIPWSHVRVTEEVMDRPTFVRELAEAETMAAEEAPPS